MYNEHLATAHGRQLGNVLNSADPPPIDRAPLWRVSDLSLSYGGKKVLSGVSMEIPRAGVTAIIGPSGCGKSSFLFCLNKLSSSIDGCTVDGRICFGSLDIMRSKIDATELRKQVGFIFQKPTPFPFSIRRNLELPLREHGAKNRSSIDEAIEHALCSVGLWNEVKDRLDTPALQLSGGQQQRLCIARALALKPEALLMDEPCSALDPMATSCIEDLICSFKERLTIVIVTHNLRQAQRIGDQVAVFWLKDGIGRLIEIGEAAKIFASPRHASTKLYLCRDLSEDLDRI